MSVIDLVTLILSAISALGLTGGTILYFRINRRQKQLENDAKSIENETDLLDIVDKQQATIADLMNKQAELISEISTHRDDKVKLRNEIMELKLDNERLKMTKCEVRGCTARRPPSETMM
jgi:cell division protein FtsB